jgi:trimethylamine:corrinoid methyltransferase-like protein
VFELVERCTQEIEVNDETLAFDTIVQVGIGGSHLDTRHTLRWLRSGEHYYGGSYSRSGRPGEEHTMLARAHERVQQILARPMHYAAPPEAVGRLRAFVEAQASAAGVPAPTWPQL